MRQGVSTTPNEETVMAAVNRRKAIRWTAGLAAGLGMFAGWKASAQEEELSAPSPPAEAADEALERAIRNPTAYMFSEQVTFRLEGDGHSRDLYFTSARDANGK